MTNFGIVAMASVLGQIVPLDREKAWGFHSFSRAEPNTLGVEMAAQAASKALARANVCAEEVDLVVFASAFLPDYLIWDPSTALQHLIGTHNATSLWVQQACVSSVTAFEVIAGRLLTQPKLSTVVLASANKVREESIDRVQSIASVLADGAAAAVLRRDAGRIRWLTTASETDGRFSDFFKFSLSQTCYRPRDEIRATLSKNDLDRFGERIALGHASVLTKALEQAGRNRHDVSRLFYFHDNQGNLERLSRATGIPLEKMSIDFSYGHMGAADQLFDLSQSWDRLQEGELLALLGMGYGWQWACTLLEVNGR